MPGRRPDRYQLRWSPNEQYVAYWDGTGTLNEVTQLWVFRLADGDAVAVTDDLSWDTSPSWSRDSATLYFVSNRGGSRDLWMQALDDGVPTGDARQVTTGVGMWEAIFEPDGSRLAYVTGGRVSNLWRVPIRDDRPVTWADAEQLTFDDASIEFVDLSPDGSRLAFSSDRRGNQDLWVLATEGGEMRRLTTEPTPDWDPS